MLTMTRAEYEATYGVAPVATPASRVDTTPAPARMTRAEYEAEYGQSITGEKKQNFLTSTEPFFRASMGGAETIAPNIAKTFGNIPSSARNLARYSVAPVNPLDQESPLNIGKNLFGGAVATKNIFKEQGFGEGLKNIGRGFADTAKKGFDIYKGVGEKIYGNLEKNVSGEDSISKGVGVSTAEAASNIAKLGIEDPLLIPSLLYSPSRVRGTGVADDLISKTARPVTRGADTSVSNISDKVQDFRAERAIAKDAQVTSKIEEEIYKIENNYSKTRRANEFSKDSGAASRKRIAQTDVLEGAVDEDGLIRTKQPGGAVDRYKAQTIDGMEGVVRQNLIREGATINLAQVERELMLAVNRSSLEGSDLIAALNGVRKELAGLRMRADNLGEIPLYKVHDAKINTTKNINYQTPPETATYRKTVARAYKTIVEDTSKTEVGKVNKELSKYYEDIRRLEELDGKRVRGGKLGKYTAQIAGNIVGGAAGGAVGGLPGTAIGAYVGGETSAFIKGQTMAGTFGKARGIEIPKNPILEKAKLEGSLPPEMNLKVPDKRVGAPKSVPKTKEVVKLEAEIKRNVEAQQKAIKTGDFTLVAKLKEVYQHLVAKLKEVIKKIKETPNKEGGFIGGSSSKSGKQPQGQSPKEIPSANSTTDAQNKQVFKNFEDLSTKLLGKLEGRSTVSKQFIEDLTNSPDLKQPERDLIRRILNEGTDSSPLLQEARKYKSVEEFVRAQGTPTFSGGSEITKEWSNNRIGNFGTIHRGKNELGGGIYITDSPEYAKTFGSQLTESSMKSNLKLLDVRESSKAIGSTELNKIKKGFQSYENYLKDGGEELLPTDYPDEILNKIQNVYGANSTDILKKAGFDGIIGEESRVGGQGGTVWNVFDAQNLKTKSQLTDIWERANKGDQINVKDFANKVKSELLPLRVSQSGFERGGGNFQTLYENVTLPDELRGPIADYKEHLYQSPISTSAGEVHFGGAKNYFAHTRIEDLPAELNYKSPEISGMSGFNKNQMSAYEDALKDANKRGTTRRVIEIQSDLFQKGRLEESLTPQAKKPARLDYAETGDEAAKLIADANKARKLDESGLSKLEPYRNTWHERVIREEVKQAAKDGKTKLQFPTGKTIDKIEGHGDNAGWVAVQRSGVVDVTPENLRVGVEILRDNGGRDLATIRQGGGWIITEVLGDGKFKAVPKDYYQQFDPTNAEAKLRIEDRAESFDISGKKGPFHDFYEKQIGRYLTNKYGAKRITDAQGVEWWEVKVDEKMKKLPIEAFATAPLLLDNEQ